MSPGVSDAGPLSIAFWDTETNGLLKQLTKIHCMAADVSSSGFLSCADQPGYMPVDEGLRILEGVDIRVAHNGVDFDERAVRKVKPWWNPKGKVIDTLLVAKLLFARVAATAPNNHKLPPQLRSRHSLEAWGLRLGEHKDKAFDGGDWQTWTPRMQEYMNQDIPPLKRLFMFLMSKKPSPAAVEIEHNFARIIHRQEAWGFKFDLDKATELAAELHREEQKREAELVNYYGEWWAQSPVKVIKKSRKVALKGFPNITRPRISKRGKALRPYVGPPLCEYDAGSQFTPVERTMFNPKSRDHVRFMLERRHGWKPKQFTKKGAPQVDDSVLRALPWPEAQQLADYYVVIKILGYLSSGKNAWLSLGREDGRMHGRVNTIGTYTHRCAHMDPNLGQVPSVQHNEDGSIKFGLAGAYGADCRALFTATPGFVLVGVDAAAIQLRLFAHYLSKFDGGEYAKIVSESDPHAWLRDTIGTDLAGVGAEGRGKSKTIQYARLLGAGDRKVGSIVRPFDKEKEQQKIGKEIRARLAERFAAEVKLKEAVTETVLRRGYILSLDGRRVDVLKAHTGLATLLQAGEAVVMKQALHLTDTNLQEKHGLVCGVDPSGAVKPMDQVDYEFCANVHDEFQADVRPSRVTLFETVACNAIRESGERLNVKCPLKGEAKHGGNWLETH